MRINIAAHPDKPNISWLLDDTSRRRLIYLLNHMTVAMESVQAVAASGAVKRALMGFDQLNRLSAKSGSGKKNKVQQELVTLDPIIDPNFFDDWENAVQVVTKFRDTLAGVKSGGDDSAAGMENAGAAGSQLARAMESIGEAAKHMMGLAAQAGTSLRDMGIDMTGIGSLAQQATKHLQLAWSPVAQWFETTVYNPIKENIRTLWQDLEPKARESLQAVKGLFEDAGQRFAGVFSEAWKKVQNVFSAGGSIFEGLKSGVLTGFKSMVNKVIGGINDVVVKPFSGINQVFASLRNFSIGSLKPFKNLDFYIPMPQIPYLAQGAVLPANKPFMAVVGDQRHGTNIEAPLDTIRQAMAEVLSESVDAQLAGHSATVEVLRQILEAVLGIRLDEGTVCRAVEQHQQKMAIMMGGY